MTGRIVRSLVALAIAATTLALSGAPATAQSLPAPSCATTQRVNGATIDDTGPDEWQSFGPDQYLLVCNYAVGTPSPTAGFAVNIEYQCPADSQVSWDSKTLNRVDDVVSKTPTEVLTREEGSYDVFSGIYSMQERAFIRIDDRTIATIVLYANVPTLDASVKITANQVARANAGAAALPCPGTANPAPEVPFPEGSGQPPSGPQTPNPNTPGSVGQPPSPPAPPVLPERRICDEVFGVLGFSEDDIRGAGIADLDGVPMAYDSEALGTEFQRAITEYESRTGQQVFLDETPPHGGQMGAVTWLFSSGGVYDDISEHYVTGKEGNLQGAIIATSRSRAAQGASPLLTPGDVFQLALEQTGGDARAALLVAHNTLRSLGRDGDVGYTGIQPDRSFFTSYLEPLREGDEQAGSWYHIYGIAFHGMLGQQRMEQATGTYIALDVLSIALLATPTGQASMLARALAGIARIAGAGIYGATQADVLANNPEVANYVEQLYRQGNDGRAPDLVKYCFNIAGGKLGQLLQGTLPRRGSPRAPASSFARPSTPKQSSFQPIRDTNGTRYLNLTGSPFSIEWVQGDQRMVLDQGADRGDSDLSGAVDAVMAPLPEADSWAMMWLPAATAEMQVTFEAAVDDAELRFNRFDLETGQMAGYLVRADRAGEQYTITLGNDRLDPDLLGPDGAVIRPELVLPTGDPAQATVSPFAPAPAAPTSNAGAVVLVGVITATLLLLLGIGLVALRRRPTGPGASTGAATVPEPAYPAPMTFAPPLAPTPPPAAVPPPTPAAAGPGTPDDYGWVDAATDLHDPHRGVIGTLVPGTWYQLLEDRGGWTLVVGPMGERGWADSAAVRRHGT